MAVVELLPPLPVVCWSNSRASGSWLMYPKSAMQCVALRQSLQCKAEILAVRLGVNALTVLVHEFVLALCHDDSHALLAQTMADRGRRLNVPLLLKKLQWRALEESRVHLRRTFPSEPHWGAPMASWRKS